MKATKFVLFALFALVSCLTGVAFADANYPYTNPTYIPQAVSPSVTLTGTGTYAVTLQNGGTMGVDVSGTCTSLSATPQVSVDGTTWRNVNAYPITTSATVTPTAAITAVGGYKMNVAGAQKARLNVTANSAACKIGASVGSQQFTTVQ